jgi:hypothetical protein
MLDVHDLQVAYGAAPARWGVSLAACVPEAANQNDRDQCGGDRHIEMPES